VGIVWITTLALTLGTIGVPTNAQAAGVIINPALSASASETAGTVAIAVVLSHKSRHIVRVTYQTFDGTATAGTDYVTKVATLTFKPGIRRRVVRIQIIDDGAAAEGNETFDVHFTSPIHATLGNTDTTVTIVEDE